MLIAIWPLVIAILGLIIYIATWNRPTNSPRRPWHEIGLVIFACGFFWLTYGFVGKTLAIGDGGAETR